MYELKVYSGTMCQDNEEWCENWRGIDLTVHMGMRNFANFDPSAQKSQKSAP